jgi:hypothetical protein
VKPPALSKRSRALWEQLHGRYELSVADEAILRRALEAYDVHDSLMATARAAGLAAKDSRALLGAARDAALVGLRHWAALGFGKADQSAPRRPGRPSDTAWSSTRRRERDHLTGQPLGPLGAA